jgi:hypothetical protein
MGERIFIGPLAAAILALALMAPGAAAQSPKRHAVTSVPPW